METQKQVVLFQPTPGVDPEGCPKCKGRLCPKCGWFIGVRFKGQHGGGRIDPRKYGKSEEKFEGRVRKKDRSGPPM
jgi:hypothetical protein